MLLLLFAADHEGPRAPDKGFAINLIGFLQLVQFVVELVGAGVIPLLLDELRRCVQCRDGRQERV